MPSSARSRRHPASPDMTHEQWVQTQNVEIKKVLYNRRSCQTSHRWPRLMANLLGSNDPIAIRLQITQHFVNSVEVSRILDTVSPF